MSQPPSPRRPAHNERSDRLDAIASNVAAIDRDLSQLSLAVQHQSEQISTLTGSTQVLAANSDSMLSRVQSLEQQLRQMDTDRFSLTRDIDAKIATLNTSMATLQGNLQAQIAAAVQMAMRDGQQMEQRSDQNQRTLALNGQQMLLTIAIFLGGGLIQLFINLLLNHH